MYIRTKLTLVTDKNVSGLVRFVNDGFMSAAFLKELAVLLISSVSYISHNIFIKIKEPERKNVFLCYGPGLNPSADETK